MNLYIFSENTYGSIYGIGTYVRELVCALSGRLSSITVIHLYNEGEHIMMKDKQGIRYWDFPAPIVAYRAMDNKDLRRLYFRNIAYLLRLHIRERKDIVFHLNYHHNMDLVNELRSSFDCRIIAVAHYSEWGFSIFDNPIRLRCLLNSKVLDEFSEGVLKQFEEERMDYEKADYLICLSHYMAILVNNIYGIDMDRIIVIPNGLTDSKQTVNLDPISLRRKWHLEKNEKIILFVGRIDEVKGIYFLIESFRKVLESFHDCRLILVGSGQYDELVFRCAGFTSTRIILTGLIERQNIYELYRLADVGVVPSLFEPFGYVPVEMMMHGLPIVATATSGLNEVVDESCGRKVPLSVSTDEVTIDTDLLAEQIVYLLRHPEEARRLGQNGRRRYLSEYTSERFGQRMLAFYESLN